MKLFKLLLKIFISLFIIFILISAGGIFYLSRGLEAGASLEINEVNLSSLKDGEYEGTYKAGRWTNNVLVTVKDHKITDIKITKDVLFKKPEVTKELINKVITEQSTSVDSISGATVICKAYLKSIEDALSK